MSIVYEDPLVYLCHGDAREVLRTIKRDSVQLCVCSPPYFGLRSYAGVASSVWGGNPECAHDWEEKTYYTEKTAAVSSADAFIEGGEANAQRLRAGRWRVDSTCSRCGAWRGHLGLEPDPDLFVEHLVEVFEEVRRTLRKDGVLLVNMGTSFAGSGKGPTGVTGIGDQETRQGFVGGGHPAIDDYYGRRSKNTGGKPRALGVPAKSDYLVPQRLALALQAAGWVSRGTIPWLKRSCMPESVTDRPVSAVEYWLMVTKRSTYFWDGEAIKGQSVTGDNRHPYTSEGAWNIDGRPVEQRKGGKARTAGDPLRRSFRNSDLYFKVLDQEVEAAEKYLRYLLKLRSTGGLVTDEDGNPLLLDVCPTALKAAHYAAYAKSVVEPWILAGTSAAGCCAECAAPWTRITKVVKRSFESGSGRSGNLPEGKNGPYLQGGGATQDVRRGPVIETATLGWQASCQCGAERAPCTVIDPFCGSGTTALVAKSLGRRAIGIDASLTYLTDIAAKRLRGVTTPYPLEDVTRTSDGEAGDRQVSLF